MDKKNRWLKIQESLKENPIKLFEEETLSIGWNFFWRQLILLSPAYLFVFYLQFGSKGLSNTILLLITLLLLPYIFYSLGVAEDWRKKGTLLLFQDFISIAKKGLSLWWRILTGWVRFIIIIVILFFIISILNNDDQFLTIIALLIWFIGSIPVMGFAVRHWNRTIEFDQSETKSE